MGRLPVICPLAPLEEGDLVRILTEPKNALIKQYQELFAMENGELEFTEGAIRAIAGKALQKNTGARGLRSIVEDVMLEIMFDLPEQQAGTRYVITDEIVRGLKTLFPEPQQKSA